MSENLHLPPRNEFIPTNFEILPREKDVSFVFIIYLIEDLTIGDSLLIYRPDNLTICFEFKEDLTILEFTNLTI